MTNDEQNALRAMIREEVNTAVYASEQRMGERMERFEVRMDKLEVRMDNLEVTMWSMNQRMAGFEERLARSEVIQKQMMVQLAQIGSVLDMVATRINDQQMSQIALEQKLEENIGSLRRDIQKLTYTVTDAIANITMRLDMHTNTPIGKAHPQEAA